MFKVFGNKRILHLLIKMKIKLSKFGNQLKADFLSIKTLEDLANVLEVDKKVIIYYLYQKNNSPIRYKKFCIKKKNGSDREILAPVKGLKIIQRKLNSIFNLIYNPLDCVFGFSNNRNIKMNATRHTRKTILNLDLKDFFTTINFGRVRGLFMSDPFKFNEKIATILAQLCCYEGALPQGAPTSPILSNMICYRMDKALMGLSKKNGLFFTRYADDITFSSSGNYFSDDLIYYDDDSLAIGQELKKIIEHNNKFIINKRKVIFISKKSRERRQVTGLVINKKLNVKRSYIRGIRAMLHAWERFGPIKAQEEHFSKYSKKQKRYCYSKDYFRKMVLGKILFVKHIRGESSPVFRRLINKYYDLIERPDLKYIVEKNDEILHSVCIVEANYNQGTGFFIEDDKILTCRHVLTPEGTDVVMNNCHMSIYKENDPDIKYKIELIKEDKLLDLAILKVIGYKNKVTLPIKTISLTVGDKVSYVGYPNYNKNDTYYRGDEKKILQIKQDNLLDEEGTILSFYTIDGPIYEGMSGGPVFQNGEVVGIIVKISPSLADAKYRPSMVLPINYLEKIYELSGRID